MPPVDSATASQAVLEGVVVAVGDVEREDVDARGGEGLQRADVLLLLLRDRSHEAADRTETPAEVEHRLAPRDRLECPRDEVEAPLRRHRLRRGPVVEGPGERGEGSGLDPAGLLGSQAGDHRVTYLLRVVGEVLPQLQVRVEGDHRDPVGRKQRLQETAGVLRHAEKAVHAYRLVVGLVEENDEPAGRIGENGFGRRRHVAPGDVARLQRGRELIRARRNPLRRLERDAAAVHPDDEIRRDEVADGFPVVVRDVRVDDDPVDAGFFGEGVGARSGGSRLGARALGRGRQRLRNVPSARKRREILRTGFRSDKPECHDQDRGRCAHRGQATVGGAPEQASGV